MLLSIFSIFSNNFKGPNTDKLLNCETKTKADIDILTPENKSYTGPMSGYYPATYGFENDVGKIGTQISFCQYSGHGSTNIISELGGHKNVLHVYYGSGWEAVHNYYKNVFDGTVEMWIRVVDPAQRHRFYLCEHDNITMIDRVIVHLLVEAGYLQFYNSTAGSWKNIITFSGNVWYHLRIDFFSSNRFDLYLNTVKLLQQAPTENNMIGGVNCTFFKEYDLLSQWYVDAVGYSWDPNYQIGDNRKEGLLLSFTNSFTPDWKGYSLDGQSNRTILGDTTIPLPPTGTHSIQIYANDTIGNLYQSELRYFTVDASPPSYTSVLESADPLELGGTETITITGVADFSGIQQVLLEFGGTNHTMTDLSGGTWHYNTWVPSSSGAYPYEIYLQDNVGHWNMTSGAIQVVDATIPIYSSVTESADPLELGATETITIAGVADFPAGIKQVLLAFGGTNHSMSDQGGGTWRYNMWTPSNVGNYPYSIYLQDNVEHCNMTSGAIQVVHILPPYSYNFNFPSTETRATSNITLQVADNVEVSQVLLYINNTDFGAQNQTMHFDGLYYWYTYTPTTPGCRMVTFYMNDTADNWNSSQYLIENIYFSPPYSYDFNFPSIETRATSNITLQVADNVEVSQVLLHINNTDFGVQNRTMHFNGTHYWYAYTPTMPGCRMVTFYMNDTLGNWNGSQYLIKNIYFSLPTYSDISYPAKMVVGVVHDILLTNVMDNTKIGNILISINSGNNASMLLVSGNTYKYSYIPLTMGANQSFTIYLIDEFGNVNTAKRIFNVTVDKEKPTWSNLIAPDGVQNVAITISIKVTDDTSIKKVCLFVSGSDFPNPNYIEMNPIGGGIYQYSFVLAIPGVRLCSIYVEDIVGNTVYVMDSFTVASAKTGEGGVNPVLEFFLNYLLIPVLSAIIVGTILVILHLYYRKNLRQQILALEETMKKTAKTQSKAKIE